MVLGKRELPLSLRNLNVIPASSHNMFHLLASMGLWKFLWEVGDT